MKPSPRQPLTQRTFLPKKYLGQNFLVDPATQERILRAGNFNQQDVVLEIGPGLGALTTRLTTLVKKIYAIETDPALCQALREKISTDRLEVIHADFLKHDLTKLPPVTKVIGNIPYNISSPIVERLIENDHLFAQSWLTVQLEFGRRLAAQPHNKDYGSLSCFVQYGMNVKILFKISPNVFRPVPKVTSCLMQLTRQDPLLKARDEKFLFKVIRQAFSQRRKKISNTLQPVLGTTGLVDLLTELGIKENWRAEDLTLTQYIRMVNRWLELREDTQGR